MMDATTPVCFLVVHESFLGRVMFEAFSVKASDAEGSPSADPCLHHSFLIWEQLHFEVQAEFCLGFRDTRFGSGLICWVRVHIWQVCNVLFLQFLFMSLGRQLKVGVPNVFRKCSERVPNVLRTCSESDPNVTSKARGIRSFKLT